MRTRFDGEALEEVDEATFYYETREEGLGEQFSESLRQCVLAIEANPHRYARVESSSPGRVLRNLSLERFPYRVIYEARPEGIVVIAVAHHRRRSNYWKRRRG
jgi:toxin ParE1/3/4